MPQKCPPEKIRFLSVPYAVFVGFSLGVIPGMEIQGYIFGAHDDHIVRKEGIEPPLDDFGIKRGRCEKMTNLAQGMNPRIGPSGRNEGHRRFKHQLEFVLDGRLQGHGVFLPLPPVVTGSVIGQGESDIFISHGTKKGNPQWTPFLSAYKIVFEEQSGLSAWNTGIAHAHRADRTFSVPSSASPGSGSPPF